MPPSSAPRQPRPGRGWAGLAALVALVLSFTSGCGGSSTARPASAGTPYPVVEEDLTESPVAQQGAAVSPSARTLGRQAFDLVNAQRRRQGRRALLWRDDLAAVAARQVDHMRRVGYLTHEDARGRNIDGRFDAAGITWLGCAENVARNCGADAPAAVALESWLESPPHRRTLLSTDFSESGLAAVYDGRKYFYFCQVFRQPRP